MKHSCKRFLGFILSFVMMASILCSSASAATQSSAYLSAYAATIVPCGNGVIVVNIDVRGKGSMKEIGAKTIFLYESKDSIDFTQVATYDSDKNPIMMGSGTHYFEDVVTYSGKVDYYYYASVYVYAANSSGGDMKRYVTSIHQAT